MRARARVCVCVPVHFAETGTTSPHLAPVVTSQHDVVSCAASCYYSHQIVCNSFDLCPDQSCYLSTRHVPDGNVTNSTAVCRHFSRKPHVCVYMTSVLVLCCHFSMSLSVCSPEVSSDVVCHLSLFTNMKSVLVFTELPFTWTSCCYLSSVWVLSYVTIRTYRLSFITLRQVSCL